MDAYSYYFQPGYASPYKLWHDRLRRRANRFAGYMQARAQNAYALSLQYSPLPLRYDYGAGFQGGQGYGLQLVMGNAIADVLISLGQPYSKAEGPTTQCQVTIDMLHALQDGYAAGTVGVPVELVAAGPESARQYAAAYKQIAVLMTENQCQFATPDPYVTEFAKELATDPESEMTNPLPADAPSNTESAAGPSTQPTRPGLSVLQSAKDTTSEPLKSMATVPTIASSTITIGSGTDAIDHFDVRNLGIKGVEAVKVMHPLQQANLAKHQSIMLFDLFRSLVARINRGRYGPPGRPAFEAVATSIRTLHAELQRRNVSVPDRVPLPPAPNSQNNQYGSLPGRSMSMRSASGYGPRQSSYRAPSHAASRSGSQSNMNFAGSRFSGNQNYPARLPSMRTQSFGNPSSNMATRSLSYGGQSSRMSSTLLVNSTYFSESKIIGSGGLSEPFTLKSGFEGELSHPLTPDDLPAGLEERDILELKAKIEHKNRSVHIDELVDRAIASRYRARKESLAALDVWLAREQAAKDRFAEGVAEEPQSSSDTEKQPHDSGAEAGSSGTTKGQRTVSFARQGSGGLFTQHWGRAGSYLTSGTNSRAPSSRSVSNGLYIPTGVPRSRMPRPILRSGSQSTTRGHAAVSKDSSDVEASEAEELHRKSGDVVESNTDKASNATDDGSDIGSFGDVKSDSAESGPSVHQEHDGDGTKDDEKTPVGTPED
ncbi:hypothetical protein LTR74_008119 [Friedmanniomyces endolithicus]|nr:hypothetical protein LTR74_008119 [Friedmanniomyces endolithicus]